MRILTGVLTAGTVLAASACGVNVSGSGASHEDRSYEVPRGQLGKLSLVLDFSPATIVGTDTTKIVVHEHLTYTKNRKPIPHHTVAGGQLTLGYSCPRGFNIGFNQCTVGYRIELPRAMAIQVGNDSAGLTLAGLAGEINASADSGRIDVTDYRGAKATLSADSGSISIQGTGDNPVLNLHADSGSIRADGVRGGRFTAGVDSGSVRAAFTTPPSLVDVGVSSGSTYLTLPKTVPYDIQTTTDSGSKDIDPALHNDNSASSKVKLRADSGSIHVDAAS